MAEDTELQLLITVVVGATDDRAARRACQGLVEGVDGRIVESGDCSDEEPDCWSIMISRSAAEPTATAGSAVLSRTVRSFLRRLGPDYARHRVSCEPPTAWTVLDDPDLVGRLVPGGERLLVEAWIGDSVLTVGSMTQGALHGENLEQETSAQGNPDDVPTDPAAATPEARLGLLVDVVTERKAAAEWPARALASRISHSVTITGCTEQPPMVRVAMDLGPAPGDPSDIVHEAVSVLGGTGWSRPRTREQAAVVRWSAAPTPSSGIAAIELSVTEPSKSDSPAVREG